MQEFPFKGCSEGHLYLYTGHRDLRTAKMTKATKDARSVEKTEKHWQRLK